MTQRTFTITSAIQALLPEELRKEFTHGDEHEFDVEFEWNTHGYAEVHSVSYMDIDCPDLRNEVEPSSDDDAAAKQDYDEAYGDYQYEQMKDRQMGL
jgi:hypothetical protein